MFRYHLPTLLFFLAVLPPLLWIGWGQYQTWRAEQLRQLRVPEVFELIDEGPIPRAAP